MKHCKRMAKAMRKASGFEEKASIAQDYYPGTAFDGLFRDLTEAWINLNKDDPGFEKAIRNAARRRMAIQSSERGAGLAKPQRDILQRGARENAVGNLIRLSRFGGRLADAIVKGESDFLRDMADALDLWTKHDPHPDKFRTLVLLLTHTSLREKGTISMRHILLILTELGIPVDGNTRRRIRTLAKELGASKAIKGKPGAPKRFL
jgi:hypothetical protein